MKTRVSLKYFVNYCRSRGDFRITELCQAFVSLKFRKFQLFKLPNGKNVSIQEAIPSLITTFLVDLVRMVMFGGDPCLTEVI